MYIVKLDNKKIFDQRIDELTLIEPVIQLEENSAGSFTFTIAKEHPYYDEIKRRSSIIQVYEDDELLFSGMVYEVTEDFFCNRKIYCEGELSYFNDTIQRPAEYHDMTVRGLLEKYINNHNAQVEKEKQFKVGMVTVTDSNNSIYCYTNMETTLSCIKSDLVDDLGGVIRVRHSNGYKYIDYLKEDDTRTNNQVIRLGENLINYKSNISSLDIATAVIPLGAKLEESPIAALDMRLDIKSVNSDLDYVADSVSVNTFGWIYKTVIWDNVTTASALKQKGIKYLEDTQFDNLVIEVNAVDMHLIDSDEVPYRLSDKIRIISAPHGLKNKYFRLTKQTINLNNPENNTITLGKEEHLSLSARTVQANSDVLKAMESITPESTILRHAKENASALINGNGENGYVVLHENDKGVVYEILIMDTPSLKTATKVWRWNQNGFGYANSKDTSGNWKFGTAITMNGAIVADYITTGDMAADRIKGGSLVIGGKKYLSDGKTLNKTANGSIVIKNSSDTQIIKLDNNGLDMDAGSINLNDKFIVDSTGTMTATTGYIAGNLNIGGKKDTTAENGAIIVKDKNDTQVLKINSSGLDMDAGTINIGENFSVDSLGNMTAKGTASITGSINTGSSITCGENFSVGTDGAVKIKGSMFTHIGDGYMQCKQKEGEEKGQNVFAWGNTNASCWWTEDGSNHFLSVPWKDIIDMAKNKSNYVKKSDLGGSGGKSWDEMDDGDLVLKA